MAHAKNYFQLGLKQALPFIFIVGPFGLVFGTIASNAGLSVIEALSFSVFVMAGSAQLTALQLMLDGSPTLIVVLSALAVNLRMTMYSAYGICHFVSTDLLRTKSSFSITGCIFCERIG